MQYCIKTIEKMCLDNQSVVVFVNYIPATQYIVIDSLD